MTVVKTLPIPTQLPSFTSGEIGVKVIDTILVVEHAVRRCGKPASSITAEVLEAASNNLHFILASLSNRGVNLWAVDRQLVALVQGQAAYTLPTGTEKLLNVMYRYNDEVTAATKVLSGSSACSVSFASIAEVHTAGFKLLEKFIGRLVVEYSMNGVEWKLYRNYDDIVLDSGWHWLTFDAPINATHIRIRDSEEKSFTLSNIVACGPGRDRSITRINRDTYTDIPDKSTSGIPNSYFFDKQIDSQIVLWPTPSDELAQVVVWRQRRIEDVGSLAHKLEIPERWFEAIIWTLAKNMSFELEGVADTRIELCKMESALAIANAELGESDGAPMYIQPNISGYTA